MIDSPSSLDATVSSALRMLEKYARTGAHSSDDVDGDVITTSGCHAVVSSEDGEAEAGVTCAQNKLLLEFEVGDTGM